MKLLIAAGGTGGHLYPALAVLEALETKCAVQALFVGTERGIEAKVLPKLGKQLELFDLRPINRVRGTALLHSLSLLPRAVVRAVQLVRSFRPDVMLSVGGYASGPVTAASIALGVPTALIEPNAIPGLTNRVLGRGAHRAYVTWDESSKYFRKGRALEVGTPVRKAFVDRAQELAKQPRKPGALRLLITGGSQGARALNEHVPGAIARIRADGLEVEVVHQTGVSERDAVEQAYKNREIPGANVVAYLDDMASAMANADLVITRAGAGAVAELCVLGRPAIYVPLPTAADDHQRKNAEAVQSRGAGRCLLQSELTESSMAELLREMLTDRTALDTMATRCRALGRADAAVSIAADLVTMCA